MKQNQLYTEKLALVRQYLSQKETVTSTDLRFINAYLRGDEVIR